jgi:hypothetical protein
MIKATIILILTIGAALALFGAQAVYARGFGGAHGGGSSAGGYHGGGYHGSSYSGGAQHEGGYSGGASHGGYSGGGHDEGKYSGAEGAAAGHAATEKKETPPVSGAEGAAAGHAAAEHEETPSVSDAGGAAAGYAAAQHKTPSIATANVALPTDAGYGMSAVTGGAYAGYHQTQAVSGSVYAARGTAVRTSFNGAGMYGQAWYGAHPGAWSAAGWTGGQAWSPATWPAVGASLGWAAGTQPIVYNYGDNVTYQGDQVCYGGQPVATADQYYQQASTLAQNAPPPDPNADGWTPLGVFALVQGDQSDPHYIVQLAVNKSGTLAGNYSDLSSGTTVLIQGAVDKRTQRVAWTVGDNKITVGETGIYNLTKDEAPVLIHIGKDKTQQWMLVRLKQPG